MPVPPRLTTSDIPVQNRRWSGAVCDGTTLWLTDWSNSRMVAFDVATELMDPSKDIALPSGARYAGGAYDSGTGKMWIVDTVNRVARCYVASTRAASSTDDINLVAGYTHGGAFASGGTLWFINDNINRAQAYLASNGAKTGGSDLVLGAGTWRDGCCSPDEGLAWIIDATNGHIAKCITLVGHVRRSANDVNLPSGTFWAAADNGAKTGWFIPGLSTTGTMLSRSSANDHYLPGNVDISGIAVNGNDGWLSFNAGANKAAGWDMLTASANTGRDISRTGGGDTDIVAAPGGSDLWILNDTRDKLESYNPTSRARQSTRDVSIGATGTWTGAAASSSRVYAMNTSGSVRAWNVATRARESAGDATLSVSGADWQGLVVNEAGGAFWGIDNGNNKLQCYDLQWNRRVEGDQSLGTGAFTGGLWWHGRFYVVYNGPSGGVTGSKVLRTYVGAPVVNAQAHNFDQGNVPEKVPNLKVINAGTRYQRLTWGVPASDSTITGYRVQVSLDGGSTWSTINQSNPNTSTWHGPLTNGQARTYRVAAINSAGLGAWSDIVYSIVGGVLGGTINVEDDITRTDIIAVLELGSGERRYSVSGMRGAGFHPERILEVSPISQDLSPVPDEFRLSELTVTLDNSDLHFTKLKAAEPFRNRPLKILMGKVSDAESLWTTIFDGTISNWSQEGDSFILEAENSFQPKFEGYVTPDRVIREAVFPNAPPDSIGQLPTLVFGRMTSEDWGGTGALHCIVVDPDAHKYVVAQDTTSGEVNVLRAFSDGEEVSSNDWSQASEQFGDFYYRTITFDDDQEHKPVTADVTGLTDGTGSLAANPLINLRQFLIWNGFQSTDFDARTFNSVITQLNVIQVFGPVWEDDPGRRIRDVIDDFARSTNVILYLAKDGTIAANVPEPGRVSQAVAEIGPGDIAEGTMHIAGPEDAASTIDYSYRFTPGSGGFEGSGTFHDADERLKLSVKEQTSMQMLYMYREQSAARVIKDRAFFLREARQNVTLQADPALYLDVDVGQDIKLTHFAGVDPHGYLERLFRVLGLNLEVTNEAMLCGMTLVDISSSVGAPSSSEWKGYLYPQAKIRSDGIRI